MATIQGHLHRKGQHFQSTTPSKGILDREDDFPLSSYNLIKKIKVAYMLIKKSELSIAYQKLIGWLPVCSSQGNEYIFVGYDYDANCILGHHGKDYTEATLKKT